MKAEDGFESELRTALAADLGVLATLHDDPSPKVIGALADTPASAWLGLKLRSPRAEEGYALLRDALATWKGPSRAAATEEIAVDHADLYLLYTFRVAPTESPWRDPEGLERQEPMFAVAEWYRRHGLAVADRQERPDDHLVTELQFLARLLDPASGAGAVAEAAGFMDAHLLRWAPAFCQRAATSCATPYFAGIALLTWAYLDELRDVLAVATGLARPDPAVLEQEEADARARAECARNESQRYVPGVAPSW